MNFLKKLLFYFFIILNINCVNLIDNLEENYKEIIIENSDQIEDIIKKNNKISISGSKFSQGGQYKNQNSICLNLKNLNNLELVEIENNKLLKVGSGAIWKNVLEFLNEKNLSVSIMQSDFNFSVGGSLSANIHGWACNKSPMIESIHGFEIIVANGEKKYCDRKNNSDLFYSSIGGYGLLGIVTNVYLKIENNNLYKSKAEKIKYFEFKGHFKNNIENQLKFFLGRPSLEKDNFMEDVCIINFNEIEIKDLPYRHQRKLRELPGFIKNITAYFFNNYKKNKILEKTKIKYEEMMMNNIVKTKNEIFYQSVFDYINIKDNVSNILQEYFIPIKNFDKFYENFKNILSEYKDDIYNITIRHVKKDSESVLNYAKDDSFAFVLLFRNKCKDNNKEFLNKIKNLSIKLTDLAISNEGSYYLPYSSFQTKEQFEKIYNVKKFKKIKEKFDPKEKFVNDFYFNYIKKD